MNRDVLLSLLALDAYNRGYGENVGGLTASGSLGRATILSDALGELDQQAILTAGFYAIAYDVSQVPGFAPGQTVISYRGTNFPEFSGGLVENIGKVIEFINKDLGGGWSIFTGIGPGCQPHRNPLTQNAERRSEMEHAA